MGIRSRRLSRRQFLIIAVAGAGSGVALWLAQELVQRDSTGDAAKPTPATDVAVSPSPPARATETPTPASFTAWGQADLTFDQLVTPFDRLVG